MNYGMPYKGSKNKLAERIVSLLPQRTHLIDMFCGGCAVSHAALVKNRFEHIHINDINPMCPQFFLDVLDGKYNNDSRWISREDFYKLKDTDPYVAFVWSFGNNLRDYLYGKDIEPLKKALHYVLYYQDTSLAKELGYDMTDIVQIQDMDMRYSAILGYFNKITPPQGTKTPYAAAVQHQWHRGRRLSLLAFCNTKGKNDSGRALHSLPAYSRCFRGG